MKKNKPVTIIERVLVIATFIALILFVVSIFTSCTSVQKLFHKEKHQSDSTSVIHERKDSTASVDSIRLHKDGSQSTNEIILDFGDKQINVPYKDTSKDGGIYVYPTTPNDYFEITPDGSIKTTMPLKRVSIKGNKNVTSIDSLAGHSKIVLSELKDDSSRVKAKGKDVQNSVHKTRFPWWLLIIPVIGYLIYRNWPKIRAVAVHLITGL